ncbi:hypothetical protein BH23GEM9_BH23GEM9_03480 [soil metagenome]
MRNFPLVLLLAVASIAAAACDPPAAGADATQTVASDGTVDLRRVWSDAREYAKPSPDGRLITFVDWTTGDVAVYDVASRTERRVTDKGTWQANGSWAEEPRFSPDGSRIVYSYGNTQARSPFVYELRAVSLTDSAQHLVYRGADDDYIVPLDWHDGAGILAIVDHAGGVSDLVVIDPETGAARVVRTFQPHESDPHRASFSSDARFIAYQYGREVRVMDANGGSDRSLDENGALLGWSLDGAGVLIHANREGTRAIWLIPVRDGRRSGPTSLVRDGIPAMYPGGFSRSAYFYTVPIDGPKLQLATIDVDNGRVLVQPSQITGPADGFAHSPAWTPDGSSYAYILNTPGVRPRIMLRSADGEQLREIATLDVNGVHSLHWEPNGRSLVFVGDGAAETAAYRLDLSTGETTRLFEPAGRVIRLTADGRTLVYLRSDGVFSRPVNGGAERRIVELPGGGVTDLAISPDGRMIAHVRGRGENVGRIVVFPIEGGAEREIMRLPEGQHFEPQANTLAWTPDGRYLVAVAGDTAQNHRLVAVALDGGALRPLLELGQRREGAERAHAKLHPDGRRILYSNGVARSEMWMLDGLRPF